MSTYQPGEIVDITIKGARIVSIDCPGDDTYLTFDYGDDAHYYRSGLRIGQAVTVERIAPAEWPPQPGDLWRDKHGALWFIHEHPAHRSNTLGGRTANGARWTDDAVGELLDACGPLTLVHREGGEQS